MSGDHLTPETIGGLIDGELASAGEAEAEAHLKDCHACALRVIAAQQLKRAAREAAHRFAPSPEAFARLEARACEHVSKTAEAISRRRGVWESVVWSPIVWGPLAAVLVSGLFLAGWWQLRRAADLSAEILDQHLAVLLDASSPEVLSSDRHTVKPWFQGKLPFAFNLPEENALPADSALLGADVSYIEGRPTAHLLFSIHKHRVSAFVSQADLLEYPFLSKSRSGFQIVHAEAASLGFVAVSDVNRPELEALMRTLIEAQ